MQPTNALDCGAEPGAVDGAASGDSGLLEGIRSLWQEVRGLAHDQLKLAALETQLAARSLVTMIAAGVMIAVLLVSAWLGFAGAVVLWLISIGVTASVALLLAVAVNLALALVLHAVIGRQSRHLDFPATLRSIRPVSSTLHASEKT